MVAVQWLAVAFMGGGIVMLLVILFFMGSNKKHFTDEEMQQVTNERNIWQRKYDEKCHSCKWSKTKWM